MENTDDQRFNSGSDESIENDSKSFFENLKKEIEEGNDDSMDPVNASLSPDYPRITTIYSKWYTRTCLVCGLKFRENDIVRLCPKCNKAYHDDDQYNLHCWQKHFANKNVCTKPGYDLIDEVYRSGCSYELPDSFDNQQKIENESERIERVSEQFLQGLKSMWKAFGDKNVIEVKAADTHIIGLKCPWCRFSIRIGDRVVKCPCNKCNTYFHNDIFRHLECWNDWNGTKGNDFCPTSGAKIEKN
ncbi:MAG: hypothetical protein OMM_03150 [Candidatus Magnetoglobus multicellularis str. Araruama]|uniref:C2H2-type domain-containing protein n=1 Tax=Candidatus Magnetoglobus multicellularis str. Araruama TaxID=890399 RepID=A0A1V1P6Y2_9BACT|nr:MAG: hypothetical protein OMM_03150 [Candidatus Magnetoglobus multicellularis str. Araruama]